MFNLDKITVEEFFKLPEEDAAKYMDLEDILLVKDSTFAKHRATELGELTYGNIGTIRRNLTEGTFDSVYDCFKIIYGISLRKYLDADIVDYFYAFKWIKQEVLKQINNEKKVLKSDPDYYSEMAGADRLKVFGEFATLLIIGRSFSKDPEEIENWKYNKVFTILAYDKIQGEVTKRYHELKYKSKT